MEKFGIFELLDTLSAIMAANPPSREEKAAPAETPLKDAEPSEKPKQPDSAFAPPPYSAEEPPPVAAPAERNALDAFLQRHDAISKNIDQNK